MSRDREALEDAFDRAEGELELAFRGHTKASRENRPILTNLTILRGREAYEKLRRLAWKLALGAKR